MKLWTLLLLVFMSSLGLCLTAQSAEEESTVKKGVKSIVSGVVSTSKDAISAVDEGLDSGRKEGDSVDGATIVSSKDELNKFLTVQVIKAEFTEPEKVQLTLAVKNDNEFPVRITKLGEMKNVVLLDVDGFSYPLPNSLVQGGDITALGKALTRVRLTFSGVEGEPAILRLFDNDITVPKAVAAPAN